MKKYGVKFRTICNKELKVIRSVYSPVIYREDGEEMFIASKDEILEFETKEEALEKAKETYDRFKGRLWK